MGGVSNLRALFPIVSQIHIIAEKSGECQAVCSETEPFFLKSPKIYLHFGGLNAEEGRRIEPAAFVLTDNIAIIG